MHSAPARITLQLSCHASWMRILQLIGRKKQQNSLRIIFLFFLPLMQLMFQGFSFLHLEPEQGRSTAAALSRLCCLAILLLAA